MHFGLLLCCKITPSVVDVSRVKLTALPSSTLAQSEIGIYSADVPEKNSRVKYDPSVVMSYALHPLRLRPPT